MSRDEGGSETIVGSSTTKQGDHNKGLDARESMGPIEQEQHHYQEVIANMLQDLRNGKRPHNDSEDTKVDRALNMLNYKNFPALQHALAKLTVTSKDKKIDVFFQAHITAMAGTLNLYLDSELSYTW